MRALILVASLALAACSQILGIEDGEPRPDARTADIDAATANALGRLCNLNNPGCPAGNVCTGIPGVGSETYGYCTPMCMNNDTTCRTDYDGPSGGLPRCSLTFSGGPPDLCVITCSWDEQCPTGLSCMSTPNNYPAPRVCAPPG